MPDTPEVETDVPRWQRGMFGGGGVHAHEWTQRHWTSRVLHRVGEAVADARTGMVAAGIVAAWALLGATTGFPGWWQTALYSFTGSITFVMVFVIQHTHERQTFATQRKLDELVRASTRADDTLIAVEEAADDQLQALADLNLADRERASLQAPGNNRGGIGPLSRSGPPSSRPANT